MIDIFQGSKEEHAGQLKKLKLEKFKRHLKGRSPLATSLLIFMVQLSIFLKDRTNC